MAAQFSVNHNIPWKTRFFTIWSGQAIGLLVAGLVAGRFSIQVWFLFGGLLCILMAICGLFIPAVMQIESRDTTMPGDVSQSLA